MCEAEPASNGKEFRSLVVPLQADFAVLCSRHEKSPEVDRLDHGQYDTLYSENISQFTALEVDKIKVMSV
jgi:hypothetical protein